MPADAANLHHVICDHQSEHGPIASHIRGTLLTGSVANLRALGVYERYLELLPQAYREQVQFAIAGSWVPMHVAQAHYETCEALGLSDEQRKLSGKMMADRIADTFLGTLLRTTRRMGVDGFPLALSHNGRLYDRMYQGGGVRVTQIGPKDVIFENFGIPLLESRYFRTAYTGYMEALVRLFTDTAYLKPARPETGRPHAIAFIASWV